MFGHRLTVFSCCKTQLAIIYHLLSDTLKLSNNLCVSVVANNVNWGVSGIEGDTDLNDLQDTVKKKLGPFGSDLPTLDQFNQTIPSLDEGERLLKEKCMKNSKLNNSYELTVVSKFSTRYSFSLMIYSI